MGWEVQQQTARIWAWLPEPGRPRGPGGAARRNVLGLILRQGLSLTARGLALGLAGAFVLAHTPASLLPGVSSHDPLVFAGVSLLLLAAAVASDTPCPARRRRGAAGMPAAR